LGFISCVFAALTVITLLRMRVGDSSVGIRMSSVIMLLNLVLADFLRVFFNWTGMIRYIIIHYIKGNSNDECSPDLYCKVQSFFSIWFNMIVFICIFFIGVFAIYQLTGKQNEARAIEKKTLYHTTIFCWVVPFLLTLIPAFYNVLGEDEKSTTNGWCWITSCNQTSTTERIAFMLLYSRAFEAFIFMINLTLFIFLQYLTYKAKLLNKGLLQSGISISAISDIVTKGSQASLTNDSKLLFLINISICFSRLWGLVRTALNVYILKDENKEQCKQFLSQSEEILTVFQAVFENLQSIFVFFVLMLCSKFAKMFLKRLICQCQCSWRKRYSSD